MDFRSSLRQRHGGNNKNDDNFFDASDDHKKGLGGDDIINEVYDSHSIATTNTTTTTTLPSLSKLIEMRQLAKSRQLTPSQTEVIVLAVMRMNLLLQGSKGSGKRWVARHATKYLSKMGERVEKLVKCFGVNPEGSIWVSKSAVEHAMKQLAWATVIVVEDVPSQPQAAAAFLSHLDFLCRLSRCVPFNEQHQDKPLEEQKTTQSNNISIEEDAVSGEPSENLSFGGIQIIATQNTTDSADSAQPQPPLIAWTGRINAPNVVSTSEQKNTTTSNSDAPPPKHDLKVGVMVTHTAATSPSPHSNVFVVVFR